MKPEAMDAFIKAGSVTISNYLLEHYQDIGMNNEQLLVFIQLKKALERGQDLPDLTIIAKFLRMTKNAVANVLQSMVAGGFAEIKTSTNEFGQKIEQLNFDGLYTKLLGEVKSETPIVTAQQSSQATRQEVFATIESEFRRPLSTFELQTVSKWLDDENYIPETILMALKEAVLNNVYNFRYIEQILVSWRQKNIQTEMDVAQNRNARQQKMNTEKAPDNMRIRNIPYIDIMNLENN
ncbi:DnaD domain protein [Periweissella fabaria]|uniref:DNA replication protein DnaD n=1 Tax=Periweissella fabaria TaxID=546157 RepID=A0ABM8Z548_9LACO|nr:DnaD domain protein [Periweissella fabaria]MCM0596771.1 DnaD domain protein [Periweissella fabaria]CAH0416303.1 DNA replication protein DnaD [Periweissella fabaria]